LIPKEALRSESEERWRIALPLERSMGLKDRAPDRGELARASCAVVTVVPHGSVAEVSVSIQGADGDHPLLLSPNREELPVGLEVPDCVIPPNGADKHARILVRNTSSTDCLLEPGLALGGVCPIEEDFDVHNMEPLPHRAALLKEEPRNKACVVIGYLPTTAERRVVVKLPGHPEAGAFAVEPARIGIPEDGRFLHYESPWVEGIPGSIELSEVLTVDSKELRLAFRCWRVAVRPTA
ncbi:DNA-(apurinic or apyrimidinic site) lyase, partial [Perkinsus chesapeaki]